MYVDGGKDIIVQNNTITGSDVGLEIGCENAGFIAENITVRNNIIYKNEKAGLGFGGYDFPATGQVQNCIFTGNTVYDNDILNTLRKFRDSEMGGKSSEDLKQYYTMAQLIVPHIENKPEILLGLLKDYLVPAVALINKGKNIEAKELYKRMVLQLRQTYLDAGQANG